MKKFFFLVLPVCALLLTGCMTMPLPPGEIGSPEDSVLVYGLFTLGANGSCQIIQFTQLDPAFTPGTYNARSYIGWTLGTLPPGGRYKLVYYFSREKTGNYIAQYAGYPGIQGNNLCDFRLPDKPGLFYAGSYSVSPKDGSYSASPKTGSFGGVFSIKEIHILKNIKGLYKNTAWEPLIEARIQELENE